MPLAPGTDEAGTHVGNDVGIGRQHGLELLQVALDLRRCGVIAGRGEVVVEPDSGLHPHAAQAGKARVQRAEQRRGQIAPSVGVQLHLGQHQTHAGVVGRLRTIGIEAVDEVATGPAVEPSIGVGNVGAGGAEVDRHGCAGGRRRWSRRRSGCGSRRGRRGWGRGGSGRSRDVAGLGHAGDRVAQDVVAAVAVERAGDGLVVVGVGRPVVQDLTACEVASGLAPLVGALDVA